jgi:FtsP/CotA-like multicopper oxidase with cupredoxin domain
MQKTGKWSLVFVAIAGAALTLRMSAAPQDARAGQTGAPFREPEVRRSANGVLKTTLDLRLGTYTVAGRVLELPMYEGGIPGPTFRLQPGDRLQIRYANNLKFPDSVAAIIAKTPMPFMPARPGGHGDAEHSDPRMGMLLSNLHTHGLQVTPAGNSDNPFLIFKPGQTFDYDVPLPADQPAGLHWYHPHRHGSSAKQGWAGLGGAIVVEGAIDRVPEVAAAPERLMLLQELWVDNNGHVPLGMPIPVAGKVPFSTIPAVPTQVYYTINGVHQPVIRARPGSVERWRINNESPHKFARLSLTGHTLYQIGQDGIPFASPMKRNEILITPGNRVELLVKIGARGTYKLRALEYDQGHPGGAMPEELLATVISEGAPADGRLPEKLVAAYPAITGEPVVAKRTVVFSGNTTVAPVQFFLDGKAFDGSRDDAVVKAGTVEEWTLVNDDVFQHPFHIHINPFQVIEINGKPVTDGVWWDTFPLPAKGSIKVRMKFRPDVPGRTVYHCHILPHEDNGMMSAFTILPLEGGRR